MTDNASMDGGRIVKLDGDYSSIKLSDITTTSLEIRDAGGVVAKIEPNGEVFLDIEGARKLAADNTMPAIRRPESWILYLHLIVAAYDKGAEEAS